MQVQVKLFATLRQHAGWSESKFTLPEGATVTDLINHIISSNEDLADWTGRAIYAAVNQEYADADYALTDGDMVAMFPPVSGGSHQ